VDELSRQVAQGSEDAALAMDIAVVGELVYPELIAMYVAHRALSLLSEDAQRRTLTWVGEALGFEMNVLGP
jgi:hypothetical protein